MFNLMLIIIIIYLQKAMAPKIVKDIEENENISEFSMNQLMKRKKNNKRKPKKIISNTVILRKNSDGTTEILVRCSMAVVKVQTEDKFQEKALSAFI